MSGIVYLDRPKKSPRYKNAVAQVRHREQVALGRKLLSDMMPYFEDPQVLLSSRKWFEVRDKIIFTLRSQGLSLTAIGVVMDRDHSTIVHSLKRTERRLHEQSTHETQTCPMCGQTLKVG